MVLYDKLYGRQCLGGSGSIVAPDLIRDLSLLRAVTANEIVLINRLYESFYDIIEMLEKNILQRLKRPRIGI